MSISGILESLATYYKERMFGQIHELTYNTENALFDGLTATNRPPLRKVIREAVCLDLANLEEEQQPVLYTIQHNHNQGALDSITITFPQYGGSHNQPALAKYDYRHGIADIHISGPTWKSIKIMAGSSYIVTEYNIPDPDTVKSQLLVHPDGVRLMDFRSSIGVYDKSTPHGIKKGAINHIVWQTDAGRALPFLKSQDLVIIILLESSAGLIPPNLQLSFNIVELDNPVNTEVSHVPLKLNSKPTPSGREFNVTSVPLHWAYNPVHTVHKQETMLTFPVLTMDTYESVLTGANPQNIRMPFNHPVLSMSIQVVDIPIKSAVFIPFPFDDKRNYKIPLEFNTETRCWEIIFQNPVAPLAELFSDKTTINFSKLTNPDPVLVITPETISVDDTNHSWKVNIWVCQRNICRVMSGMAGLAFMG